MIISTFLYFGAIAALVAITSIAVGLGESLISQEAIKAIDIQPSAKTEINKAALLGIALNETSAIIGLVTAIILFSKALILPYAGLPLMGIFLAVALPGFAAGIASSGPIVKACQSIMRQPFFSSKIVNLMLITTSFIQTPVVFGFIISLFIYYQIPSCTNYTQAVKLFASGLSIGLGGIGSILGLSHYAKQACASIGYNRNAYFRIITFTFISQALIETPVIFALITSLLILNTNATSDSLVTATALITAALCTAISNLAPGISSGKTAAAACHQITLKPESYSTLSKASLVAQGMLDSFAIYGWAVSLFILLKQ
jgi:F0F1-type ATP synthase membrane subunit c/vacuolar-type H+-ATPase subunit K